MVLRVKYFIWLVVAVLNGFITASSAFAQEYSFRHLSVEEGLSQSAVFSVEQDDIGYMWFGTADGLNRYNGYEFIHFRNEPSDPNSISGNFISCVTSAKEGALWVGTRGGGFNHYNPKDQSFTRYISRGNYKELSHNDIYSIYENEEALYIGTYEGLSITKDLKTFTNITRADSQIYTVHNIMETAKGEIVLAHDYGVSVWDVENEELICPSEGIAFLEEENVSAYSLLQTREGDIWVGTDLGVYIYDEHFEFKDVLEPYAKGFNMSVITSLFQDEEGSIWIGSNGEGAGIHDLETKTSKTFTSDYYNNYSVSGDVVTSICQDRSGVVWIGTYDGGINKYDKYINQFRLYAHTPDKRQSLSVPRVFAMAENDSGDLWVGTDGGGLDLIDHRFNKNGRIDNVVYEHFDEYFKGQYIWAIEPDGKGNMYVGTIGDGIKYFNPITGILSEIRRDTLGERSKGLSDDSIYALHLDQSGDLWIGTDMGLNRYNTHTGECKYFNVNRRELRPFSSNTILTIEEDDKGTDMGRYFRGRHHCGG